MISFTVNLMQVQFNPSQSLLTMEGDDVESFDKAMQHISYLNSRQFPTPGIRRLKVTTTVKYVKSFRMSSSNFGNATM